MAGRKKKMDEFLKEQESMKADLGDGREVGASLHPDAGPEDGRQPIALVVPPDGGVGERSELEPPGLRQAWAQNEGESPSWTLSEGT